MTVPTATSRDACAAVIAGPRVGERLTSHHGRPERVIAFARREQTGIGRDDGSAKLKHQSAVDTRRPCCSMWQQRSALNKLHNRTIGGGIVIPARPQTPKRYIHATSQRYVT